MKYTLVYEWSSYDCGGMRTHKIEASSDAEAHASAVDWMAALLDEDAEPEGILIPGEAIKVDAEQRRAEVKRDRLEKAAEARLREVEAMREAADRAEYERLRAKFEGEQ